MNDEELNSWISKNNAGLFNGNTEGMNGYVQCFNSGIHFGFEQGAKPGKEYFIIKIGERIA